MSDLVKFDNKSGNLVIEMENVKKVNNDLIKNMYEVALFLEQKLLEVKKTDNSQIGWIPTKFGVFPVEGEIVQVTYKLPGISKRYCDRFAYRYANNWKWLNSEICDMEIVAWKHKGEPYRG